MTKFVPDKDVAPQVAATLHGIRAMRRAFGGELTINQWLVAQHVFYAYLHGQKCSQSSIIATEGLPKTTVFNAILRLKELGLVSVTENPEDSRMQHIVPTEKCIELRNQIWRELLTVGPD
jgi:DNA-binding MarR family transcriptional regulator